MSWVDWIVFLFPLISFLLVLWLGVVRGLAIITSAALLLAMAPFVVFGILAVWEGESVSVTFSFLKDLKLLYITMSILKHLLPTVFASVIVAGGLSMLWSKFKQGKPA
jgi:hypothetical protein